MITADYNAQLAPSALAQKRLRHLFDRLQWFSSVPHNNVLSHQAMRRSNRTSIGRAAREPRSMRTRSQEPRPSIMLESAQAPRHHYQQSHTLLSDVNDELPMLIGAQEAKLGTMRRQLSAELLSIDDAYKQPHQLTTTQTMLRMTPSRRRQPVYIGCVL